MDKNLRSYMAELVGTFALVFVGASAVCGNQAALQSEQPAPGLVGIALAQGLVLAVALACTVPLEGGYLNPAVTLMLWVFKRLDGARTTALIFVQLLGAALAGGLVRLIFSPLTLSLTHNGSPYLNLKAWNLTGVSAGAVLSGIVTELCLTFIFTVVIFGTLIDPRAPRLLGTVGKWLAPLWVGLVMVALMLAGYSLTGAAVNPARWFGTAVWESAMPSFRNNTHMIYWIGPIVGALLAGGLYTVLILPPEEEEAAVTSTPAVGAGKSVASSTLFRSKK